MLHFLNFLNNRRLKEIQMLKRFMKRNGFVLLLGIYIQTIVHSSGFVRLEKNGATKTPPYVYLSW